MNNRSVPSTHTERQITDLSIKHSFTLYPSLSPYRWMEWQRNKYTCCAWAGGTYFPVVVLCFWFCWEIGFGFTYLCTYSTIQFWCCVSFWFWQEIVFGVTYILSVQYSYFYHGSDLREIIRFLRKIECIDLNVTNLYMFYL